MVSPQQGSSNPPQTGFRLGIALAGMAVVGCFVAATLLSSDRIGSTAEAELPTSQMASMTAIGADER